MDENEGGNENTECNFANEPNYAKKKKTPNPNTLRMKIRMGSIIKSGRFVSLLLALLVVCHTTAPTPVSAVSTIRYFRNDHPAGDRAPRINHTENFAPICDGSRNNPPLRGPRLPGLNLVRAFAGGQTCPGTNSSNRFDSEVTHVFLVDDTRPISGYLRDHLLQQNLLTRFANRHVVAPGIRTFQYQGRTVSFLVAGEIAFRRMRQDPARWFASLNNAPRAPAAPLIGMGRTAYMVQCAEANVPLPPIWKNDPAENAISGWQYRGRLLRPVDTATRFPITEVWAYQAPGNQGICMALPRKNGTGNDTIELLGIICQSERTGKACFWDNINKTSGQRLRGRLTNNMGPNDMQDGTRLFQNCTDCHRGKNVFLIPNGGRPLSLHASPARASMPELPQLDTDPEVRYQPLSGANPRPTWVNPPPLIQHNRNSNGCNKCHEIPALTTNYCRTVFEGVLENNFMPLSGNWRTGQHLEDVRRIREECARLSPPRPQ